MFTVGKQKTLCCKRTTFAPYDVVYCLYKYSATNWTSFGFHNTVTRKGRQKANLSHQMRFAKK